MTKKKSVTRATHKVDRKAVILESEVKLLRQIITRNYSKQFDEIILRLTDTFDAYEPKKVAQANEEYGRDGEIEIDDGATCSRGEDSGCYVQAWVWVYDAEKSE